MTFALKDYSHLDRLLELIYTHEDIDPSLPAGGFRAQCVSRANQRRSTDRLERSIQSR